MPKESGWLNIDKPSGIGSTKIVSIVRKIVGIKKVGHAGTLDPLASGVLPIAVGEATKTIQFAQDAAKEYICEITFGAETTTDDSEGDITRTCEKIPAEQEVIEILQKFIGNIKQIPPKFSAIKISGKRAYDLARNNEEFVIKQRDVCIKNIELLEFAGNVAKLKVICGKGTYIRSLARDIAREIGSLGYISFLRRTKVGVFTENNIISLENLKKDSIDTIRFLKTEIVLDDILAYQLSSLEKKKLKNGVAIPFAGKEKSLFKAMFNGKLIAIVEGNEGYLKPKRVFNL